MHFSQPTYGATIRLITTDVVFGTCTCTRMQSTCTYIRLYTLPEVQYLVLVLVPRRQRTCRHMMSCCIK